MEVGTSSVLMLPYTASSVGVARRRLIGDLTEAGVFEATACDAGLVLSELVSNALRHARPLPGSFVRVCWQLSGDTVEVAVSDGGASTVPAVNKPAASAVGGRGLGIVDRLSLRWGVSARPDGEETTVWAELAVSREAERHSDSMAANGSQGSAGQSAAGQGAAGQGAVEQGLVIASSRDA
jgi:anti-sigma regulatory factor (Ser/Thr protein kinase)